VGSGDRERVIEGIVLIKVYYIHKRNAMANFTE
jgi:hypothetical protein